MSSSLWEEHDIKGLTGYASIKACTNDQQQLAVSEALNPPQAKKSVNQSATGSEKKATLYELKRELESTTDSRVPVHHSLLQVTSIGAL